MTAWTPAGPDDWDDLPQPLLDFWTERHLLTLTTLRPDGTPHVVPVGVALDVEQRCAWVITSRGSRKVRNLRSAGGSGPVAACQVDGPRWSTLEGVARVTDEPAEVARAVERYASRYRVPRENSERVALRIEVARILHGARL